MVNTVDVKDYMESTALLHEIKQNFLILLCILFHLFEEVNNLTLRGKRKTQINFAQVKVVKFFFLYMVLY